MTEYNKNYTRNTNDNRDESNNEIAKLIAENMDDFSVIMELRKKYKDSKLVDSIFDAYKLKRQALEKYALKFKEAFAQKTRFKNYSNEEMIKRAKKYASRHNITDEQFDAFVKLILTDTKEIKYSELSGLANTKIAKTLGYQAIDIFSLNTGLNYDPKDADKLNDIINLENSTKVLHNQVVLQGFLFEDCANQIFYGMRKFEHFRKNAYSFIHPILFAMFVHKINVFDEVMLYSSIGNLMKLKYKNAKITTKPDFELYWNLLHDPSESVCNVDNALQDLKNRFMLQIEIWKSVLHLRQGNFYDDSSSLGFSAALENCENRIYDFPDLSLIQDEGTIMKKLLGAFGLRPTIVATTMVSSNMPFSSNIYGRDTILNTAGPNLTNLTSIPMLTLRLPLAIMNPNSARQPIHLQDTFTQMQWFLNIGGNREIVPKTQSMIHTNNVLIFYVVRRYQSFNLDNSGIKCNFATLPLSVSGLETVNDHPVDFEHDINIQQNHYKLASVVCVSTDPKTKVIIGCVAAVVIPADVNRGRMNDTCVLYDPINASVIKDYNGSIFADKPIVFINKYAINIPQARNGDIIYTPSLEELAKTRGTIFIYKNVTPNRL
ncbi:P4B major core protein [Hokovirus HKV1]|uniref:p4B major core protein n=1 Tax=Hokovirus HKV1 TaxID=1977638 RepID=A0A1V0SFZ6_9VIRU|nr:P4B major core protein [Hokovirus HKV1]